MTSTESTTATLADFLLARVADGERTLRTEREQRPHSTHGLDAVGTMRPDICPTCRRLVVGWSSRAVAAAVQQLRALIECEARRRLVEEHSGSASYCGWTHDPNDTHGDDVCITLQLVALPYATHPDYRQEWKP